MAARIIVIDNDEATREFLTAALGDEGWEVRAVAYARVDLAALKQFDPDLIILDFTRQTGGSGWEFLQLLKMEDTTARTPVLITTTAFQLTAELRGYLLSRHISVVNKPFELAEFLRLVQKTLTLASQVGLIFTTDRILPILVVEDQDDLRESLATVLRLEGYLVVTAENGRIALDAVSIADHCLIVLDIDMPIMNGFEFLTAYNRQLRPHSPVIILSGEADVRDRLLPTFVIDVLPKPLVIDQLLNVVARYAQLV